MSVTTPTALRDHPPPEPLVRAWIDFIRAMEDHYAAEVRQTDAEVRTAAEQVAACGVQPPMALPAQRELAVTTR
jgi:hypothetical protein